MKATYKILAITTLVATISACQSTNQASSATALNFKEGDTLQALVNVHGDLTRGKLYALNYQLPEMIPVCSEIRVDSIKTKAIKITYQGSHYSYLWDGHTKKAGQSLAENFQLFFGKECDKNALAKLNKKDKAGVEEGTAQVGMSKQAVLFAMGYPPIHATPTIEENSWLYWRNRFGKRAIEFSKDGKVSKIR